MIGADLHEDFDGLAFHGVGNPYSSGFRYSRMRYQRAFFRGNSDTVSGNIEHVIVAAEHSDVSVLIFHGYVASHVTTGNDLPVALVAGGVAPYGAQHVGKAPLQPEPPANIRRRRIAIFVEHIGLGSRHGNADFSRTCRHGWRRAERGAA